MAKLEIANKNLLKMLTRIDKQSGKLKEAADEALTKSQEYVQSQVVSAASPYASGGRKGYATGKMYSTLINKEGVTWKGDTAEIRVGFDLEKKGGYHSIFVMHGTHGTPRIKKDMALWRAIFGQKTKAEIRRIQKEVMEEYLKLGD